MINLAKLRPIIMATSIMLFSLTPAAYADGYHYKIQTEAQFLANAAGELAAINLAWTYAPNEGSQLLADRDLSSAQQAATLKQLGQAMLDDLFEFGYYSQLAIDGQPTLLSKVQDYKVSVGSDQSLTLDFRLPLKTATNINSKQLEFKLVDPDGVASLVFSSSDKVSLDDALTKTCSKPRLTEETLKLPNAHTATIATVQISCK